MQSFASTCNGAQASLSTVSKMNTAENAGKSVDLDVMRIRGSGTGTKIKALFVFGEHARELITGEAALGLTQALCGQGPSAEHASRVLENVDFVLVPNANPISRKQVEDGFYCKRTNEDGVDLNRNWSDEHRDRSIEAGDELFPGPSGFSEPETQLLKQLVDDERPDIYLSVHSGAYLLGMPYGYDKKRTPDDQAAMLEVLKPISERFCGGNCPFGNLADLIHYDNPGCDIDYVYDAIKTPYVFTWEIYVGEDMRGRYEQEAHDRSGAQSLVQEGRKRRLRAGQSSAAEVQGPEAKEEVTSCMDQFNPQSESETQSIVQNWASAFLELSAEVAAKHNGGAPATDVAANATAVAAPMSAAKELADFKFD